MNQMQGLLLVAGVVGGILSGIFGIGGGAILVPILVLALGIEVKRAAGISSAALLLPVGILGVWEYVRCGRLDRDALIMAAWVAAGLLLGTWVGAKASEGISSDLLRKLFAVMLVLLGVRFWFGHKL